MTNNKLNLHLTKSSSWEVSQLAMPPARVREEETCKKKLAMASHATAKANEGEMEEAETRLKRGKSKHSRGETQNPMSFI